MVNIVCVKGSMNKKSRTAVVIDAVIKSLKKKEVSVDVIDLREINMEFCDGRSVEKYNEDMQNVIKTLKKADAVVIGMPVYQYSVAGPLKNFLDITAEAFYYKLIGIVENSGGIRSYLAASELIKIMSFEVFAKTIMPIVHSWQEDFKDYKLINKKIFDKIEEMIEALLKEVKK